MRARSTSWAVEQLAQQALALFGGLPERLVALLQITGHLVDGAGQLADLTRRGARAGPGVEVAGAQLADGAHDGVDRPGHRQLAHHDGGQDGEQGDDAPGDQVGAGLLVGCGEGLGGRHTDDREHGLVAALDVGVAVHPGHAVGPLGGHRALGRADAHLLDDLGDRPRLSGDVLGEGAGHDRAAVVDDARGGVGGEPDVVEEHVQVTPDLDRGDDESDGVVGDRQRGHQHGRRDHQALGLDLGDELPELEGVLHVEAVAQVERVVGKRLGAAEHLPVGVDAHDVDRVRDLGLQLLERCLAPLAGPGAGSHDDHRLHHRTGAVEHRRLLARRDACQADRVGVGVLLGLLAQAAVLPEVDRDQRCDRHQGQGDHPRPDAPVATMARPGHGRRLATSSTSPTPA